jgi:5'-nucleotidase
MSNERRAFLKVGSVLAGTALLSNPLDILANVSKKVNTLTENNSLRVYQTNDLLGKLTANYNNIGGLPAVKSLISQQEFSGLIIDAGNFIAASDSRLQHEQTIHLMNAIGHHVATPGKQELMNGQAYLADLAGLMNFTLLNCNYIFSDKKLASYVKPYEIINFGKHKVGITGVGADTNTTGISVRNPYQEANKIATYLKMEAKCDLVICLSNLGFNKELNNQTLASASKNIDFIAAGQGERILQGAMVLRNAEKQQVILSHAANQGIAIGVSKFSFNAAGGLNDFHHKYMVAGLSLNENRLHGHTILRDLASNNKSNGQIQSLFNS